MRVRIEQMLYGGAGDGGGSDVRESVSVPFSLPGEVIERETGEVIEASPDRVVPRCVHFGTCGGCQYQHASYAAQVRIKAGILRDVLAAGGVGDLPEVRVHTAEPWGYRNRIRLRVARVDGELRMGYNRRGTYAMLPIRECPIAAPLLLRAAAAVVEMASGWAAQTREIELFCDADEARLQMTLFLPHDPVGRLGIFCEAVKARVPELVGAGVTVVGASGRGERPGVQWGAPGLQYVAADRSYWVSRGSFFQVNRFLVDELVHLATGGRRGELAWDLYAGVGLFSRALAESFAEVVGVETVGGDLAAVLKGPGKRAVSSTTVEFLRGAVLQRERSDLIVMDPPRAGVGTEVCALLGRVRAARMIYVSCDPVTLARDLKAMVDSGYTVGQVHLVDLFPQTFHMETVVVLDR